MLNWNVFIGTFSYIFNYGPNILLWPVILMDCLNNGENIRFLFTFCLDFNKKNVAADKCWLDTNSRPFIQMFSPITTSPVAKHNTIIIYDSRVVIYFTIKEPL